MMARHLRILCIVALLIVTTPGFAAGTVVGDERFQVMVAEAKAAMLRNPEEAIDRAVLAGRYAGSADSIRQRNLMRATAQWLEGEAYLRLNDVNHATPLIDQALATVSNDLPGSQLNANLLLSAGGIATEKANVAAALTDYQRAHDIFARIGEVRNRAKALIQIASLYAGGNDHKNALKYFDQALDIYQADEGLSVAIFNGRGNALKELGQYTKAEEQFDKALVLARRIDSPLLTATVLCNVARSQLLTGRVDDAQRTIDEGMRITANGEGAAFRPVVLAIAAQAKLQAGDLISAKRLIDARFVAVDLAKTTLVDRDAHETAYRIYDGLGLDDLALRHLVALKRLDDEATKLATNANTALMGARFDFANQELRIVKLKADEAERNVAFERSRAQTQRYVFLGTAGATLVIIAMLLFGIVTIRRSRDKVRAANDDLAVTNAALGKALAAKTEFLATTSHEIRTPLNGILGMTQVMLADGSLAAPTRDRLRVVHGAGVTMKALVDDILDVAKMETGNLTIEDAPFDLKATLADSLRLWEDQAHAKGIAFVCDLSACPQMVQGDAARVRQVAFNLLSNAIKFTPAGEIGFRVAVAGDRYRIVVSDSGVGIPAEKLDEVFESFRQADTSTTRQFGGTGLGLSICRNLARAMGGTVEVASVVGRGSTFTVDLPLVPVEAAAAVAIAADAPALLVLDRNPITRAMLRTLVSPHVGRVELVGTIDDAIAAIDRGGIERVLIDDATVRGEGMTIDLARLAGTGVPVAILYAGADDDARVMLRDAGVAQVVAKPVTGVALIAALRLVDPPLVSRAA